MASYLQEFLIFFFLIYFGLYIIPVGIFYLIFHYAGAGKVSRIQKKKPSHKDLTREFLLSTTSSLIFSICALITYQFVKNGNTAVYQDWTEYPLYYAVMSFFLCLVVHDTYFYWAHRFMHLPGVFKYFHLGHHRSVTPSPWSALAFQPLEAVVQYGTFAVILFFIPVHPAVFAIYLVYDTIVNTAGHNGVELVPKWISSNPIFKYGNTVTHHDAHHRNSKKNFGAFFNIWDRLMGTFLDETTSQKQVQPQDLRKQLMA